MDQNVLKATLGLVGFYTIYCSIVYLLSRRSSPKRAIGCSVGWVSLITMMWVSVVGSIVLFMVLVITSLIVSPAKVDTKLQAFFTANRIYKATTTPEQVAQLLGTHCYTVTGADPITFKETSYLEAQDKTGRYSSGYRATDKN